MRHGRRLGATATRQTRHQPVHIIEFSSQLQGTQPCYKIEDTAINGRVFHWESCMAMAHAGKRHRACSSAGCQRPGHDHALVMPEA